MLHNPKSCLIFAVPSTRQAQKHGFEAVKGNGILIRFSRTLTTGREQARTDDVFIGIMQNSLGKQ